MHAKVAAVINMHCSHSMVNMDCRSQEWLKERPIYFGPSGGNSLESLCGVTLSLLLRCSPLRPVLNRWEILQPWAESYIFFGVD